MNRINCTLRRMGRAGQDMDQSGTSTSRKGKSLPSDSPSAIHRMDCAVPWPACPLRISSAIAKNSLILPHTHQRPQKTLRNPIAAGAVQRYGMPSIGIERCFLVYWLALSVCWPNACLAVQNLIIGCRSFIRWVYVWQK